MLWSLMKVDTWDKAIMLMVDHLTNIYIDITIDGSRNTDKRSFSWSSLNSPESDQPKMVNIQSYIERKVYTLQRVIPFLHHSI